jgi:hypothetical protein
MNNAWLILQFSGWYVEVSKLETSEGKTLVGKTVMNVRKSRFTASSETRSISSASAPRGRVLQKEVLEKHDLCSDPPPPHTAFTEVPTSVCFGRSDHGFAREPLVLQWCPSAERAIYECERGSTVLSIKVFVFKVGRVLVEDAELRLFILSYLHHAVSAPRWYTLILFLIG